MWFARSVQRALEGARRNPLIQLTAVGCIALSLLLVGVVQLTAVNVRRLSLAPAAGVASGLWELAASACSLPGSGN